jgi:site-specific DNA recombinase
MKCAIYARYSSDLQRETSIEDQIRKCREFAAPKGWVILDDYVRYDQAISGAALAGRDALYALLAAAQRKPRPFDRILIDDTSRLARNVAEALTMVATLKFHGVGVYFVSQGIDTLDKSARQLVTINGMMDEQYLVGLGDKVRRGQEGRVLKGLNPGGRCYGYINVPIEDPSRPGKYGRPAVSGVKLEINADQADVVRRIFRMYAEGHGLARVAKALNAEGVPAPQPPRTRALRAWCPSSIREMLRNERYRGVQVWNRTEKQRHPETGKKISRERPASERLRVEVPAWRIVSEELWNAAHAQIRAVNEKMGRSRSGGLNRTESSRQYLFSGLLVCGECGSRMVIVSGRGTRGYVKYGCPSHRYRGVCDNKLTMRQDRLEEQLLGAIETRILTPEMIQYMIQRFEQELQGRMAEIRKQAAQSMPLAELHKKRDDLQVQAARLADAIADAGHSPALLSRLTTAEADLARVDREIAAYRPVNVAASVEQLQGFVTGQVMQLRSLLGRDAPTAKAALMKHIKQLVLTPEDQPSGRVFKVSGGIDVAVQNVMPMVARDGHHRFNGPFAGAIERGVIGEQDGVDDRISPLRILDGRHDGYLVAKSHAIREQNIRLPAAALPHEILGAIADGGIKPGRDLAGNPELGQRRIEVRARRSETLQHLHVDVEMRDESPIAIAQYLVEKRVTCASFALQHARLAAAGIHQQSDRERQAGFLRKVADGLRHAIFQQHEVVAIQIFDEPAFPVADGRQ